MKYIVAAVLLGIAGLACAGLRPGPGPTPIPATTPTPAVSPTIDVTTRPADFAVVYDWREGSMPPPYHYEYTIRLGSGTQGEIVFVPDYPNDDTPVWTETFDVTEADLTALYKLMAESGVFTRTWQTGDGPPVGGSSEDMEVTANGQVISIPYLSLEADQQTFRSIYGTIHDLVPQDIWDKLNAQHEEYKAAHSDG